MPADDRVYTLAEANALVPQVRATLLQLAVEQRRLNDAMQAHRAHTDLNGSPDHAAETRSREAAIAEVAEGISGLLRLLAGMGIQVRDLEMGLVDFPADRDGERVWLCWRLSDPEVAFWHATNEGYVSRKPW
ncbi:MAG: DUF2203 domain-containing protein [Chloroflexota bacterium]|nr:DUF2203 domain-containing protein [Chloroflexota bacterium]